MKKIILAFILLTLTACGTPQQVQVQSVQGCSAYKASLLTATELLEQGKLNMPQILALQKVDHDISPICDAKTLPADPVEATQKVTAAITTLTVQIIADKVTK